MKVQSVKEFIVDQKIDIKEMQISRSIELSKENQYPIININTGVKGDNGKDKFVCLMFSKKAGAQVAEGMVIDKEFLKSLTVVTYTNEAGELRTKLTFSRMQSAEDLFD